MRHIRPRSGHGFTLIEVVVAIAIVGLAVASLMFSMASGSSVTGAGVNLTEASFLQNQLKHYLTLNQRNKDSFSLTSSGLIQQAQQLLYAAQTALMTPIKP